jgi:NitT/TauT family transport system substrate-binding protein
MRPALTGLLVALAFLVQGCAASPQPAPAAPAAPPGGAASGATAPGAASGSAPSAVAASAPSAPPQAVKIGYAALTAANAGLFTAVEGGMFERNGLVAELVLMGAGQPSEAALISGEVPAVSASPISALNAVLAGGDVAVVGAVFDMVAYQIVGSPEIGSLADLRGKIIAINRLGGSPHSSLRLMMASAGIDLDREVRVVQTGGQLERTAAVRNGAAQATLVEPPFAQQAEAEGLRLLADSADMRIVYPVTALVVNRQWMQGNRDVARRLLQSVVDGRRAFRADRELGVRTLRRWFQVDDAALLEATYFYFSQLTPDYVLPAPEGIQRVLDEIPPERLAERSIGVQDLVDASLAQQVQ